MRILAALFILVAVCAPADADWSGSPYAGRQDYHLRARPAQGADIATRGRDVAIAPQNECWLTQTEAPTKHLPAGVRSQFIPFNTRGEFESYRANNAQGRQAVQCAFNMPIALCGESVGQTGHRPLGTVVGPFTYEDGDVTASVTLRADRQGKNDDYGWLVQSMTGSCDASLPRDCTDPDYAAAHPAQCNIDVPDPRLCDDPAYAVTHPEICGFGDPYCPIGYSTHVLFGLIPRYYDESGGDGHANPHTTVGCARASPSVALATPVTCRPSTFQQDYVRHTEVQPGNPSLSDVGFCAYYGSLDTNDWNVQWGAFPTFCAHDLGTGERCSSER